MNKILIQNKNDLYFEKAWQIYLEAFPKKERRTLKEQEKLLEKSNYKMLCYVKEDILIAIVWYWDIDSYTFLEHFAVSNKLRGQAFGSKILNEFIKNNENIILEIEPIVDVVTQKRLEFYEKFGFVINKHEHFQVPFRKNAPEIKLLFMTQNTIMPKNDYEKLYERMKSILND